MQNKNYVWLVTCDWASDGNNGSDVSVHASYESAKKMFDACVFEDKNVSYKDYDYENTSYIWEEDEDYWCIWEDGYYASEHSEIKIVKHIIKD